MRRTALVLLTATLTLTAVSCGHYDPPAAQVTEDTSADERAGEEERASRLAEELEKMADELDDFELPAFDSHAGINMKSEPMPETEPIPDDWHEITNDLLTFRVPADVEMKVSEFDLGNGNTYRSASARSEDRKISIIFFNGNDWSEDDESEPEDYGLDGVEGFEESENEIEQEVIDKGYPQEDDITDEKTARYMAEIGLEYDGTKESEYKALLEFNEDMLTEDNSEAFEYIAMVKASAIGMSTPEIYYTEKDGYSVYIYPFLEVLYDPSKKYGNNCRQYWVKAFASPDMTYSALITAHSMEEALQIASTVRITG